MSEEEYRKSWELTILADKYDTYMSANVPTSGEQVHLYVLFTETEEDALAAIDRWNTGESFYDLAMELSTDNSTGVKGGEMGWLPEGALDARWEQESFALEVGAISDALPIYAEENDVASGASVLIVGWYVIYVPEREIREIDEDSLDVLRANALMDWLWDRMAAYDVKYNGFSGGGYDSVTDAWVRWQLEKDTAGEETTDATAWLPDASSVS